MDSRLAEDARSGLQLSSLLKMRIDWCLDRFGRVAAAFLFLDAARWHISADGWVRTLSDMQARGVPAPKLLLIVAMIVSSLLALGLVLPIGIKPRWAALGLAIYTISVSMVMYNPFAHLGQGALILLLKDICIFGALLSLSRNLRERPWPTAKIAAANPGAIHAGKA